MRSVDDILAMIETVGRLVGAEEKALALVATLETQIEEARQIAAERIAAHLAGWLVARHRC